MEQLGQVKINPMVVERRQAGKKNNIMMAVEVS
jgi:hypothetical protein